MTTPPRLPYPGLRAFTREESDLFFGREGCVDAMVDRFAATRFLAVLGPSGSGKSSLVRTGFQDALDLGLHPTAGSRWKVADLHPGNQPMRNLAIGLLATRGLTDPEEIDVQLLTDYLDRGPRSVLEWAAGGNLEPNTNLLLMVDQFEELFRYGDYAQREAAEAFVALLLETTTNPDVAIHVVITMRSEYLGACALIAGLAERINVGLYLTPRMGREECREAIEGPASVIGFKVERALVNRLLNDLGSFAPWETGEVAEQAERLSRQADQLPVMQHVLNRLYVRALGQAVESSRLELMLADYEQIGGLSGALDAHGMEVIEEIGSEHTPQIESLFRALVSGTSIALAVRRPTRMGELAELTGASRESLISIVNAFRAPGCNFLRTSQSSLDRDDVIVDISHESLIRQWSVLRAWLSKEWRDRTAWGRLASAEEHYRLGEGGLLTGLDLQNLSTWWNTARPTRIWAARHGNHFDLASSFLETSQKAESAKEQTELQRVHRERVWLRFFITGLATALLISAGLGLSARREATKANLAEARARENAVEAKANAAIAASNAAEARMKEKEAAKNASESLANAEQAKENARKNADLLEGLSDELYNDQNRDLVGTRALRSQLMEKFIPYQAELSRQNAQAFAPEALISNVYRQALSFQSVGDAKKALDSYRKAFEVGLTTINTHGDGPNTDEALMATFLRDADAYAWYLLDIGETGKGGAVLEETRDVLKHHRFPKQTTDLIISLGQVENLESRYSTDISQKADAERHARAAVHFAEQALAAPESGLAAKMFAATAFGNLAYITKEPETSRLVTHICSLAKEMEKEGPMNGRSINAKVNCLTYQANEDYQKGDSKHAREKIEEGSEKLKVALVVDPGDPDLLLKDATVENLLADYTNDDEVASFKHRIIAKDRLVRALNGRTTLQSNSTQLRNIFDNSRRAIFPNDTEELKFYRQIFDVMAPTLNAFPKSPSFAYIAGTASGRIGELLYKDKEHWKEAEAYLSQSVAWFDKSGLIRNLANYSEDFTRYCGAFEESGEFSAELGRPAEMEITLGKMRSSCTPALEKYPWDFYLRMKLISADAFEGKTLLQNHRYADARVYLERASYWGKGESSNLLASMYRKGEGVPADPKKADELEVLAKKQGFAEVSIAVRFGPSEQPIKFYLWQWPSGFIAKFPGISDQVQWYRDAREAKIDQQQVDAFSQLQKIALANDDSFPNLMLIEQQSVRYDQLVAAKQQSAADRLLKELAEIAVPLMIALPGNGSKTFASNLFKYQGDQLLPMDKVAARRAYLQSIEAADRLPSDKPALLRPRIFSYEALGSLDYTEKNMDSAEVAFARAEDASSRSFQLEPTVETAELLRISAEKRIRILEILKRDPDAEKVRRSLVASALSLVDHLNRDESRVEAAGILTAVGSDEAASGHATLALPDLIRARDLTNAIDASSADGAYEKFRVFNSLGDAFLQSGSVPEARDAYLHAALFGERYIAFRLATPAKVAKKDKSEIYQIYGSLSYLDIESGHFEQAIQAARLALERQPDALWIEANMAHGLLLTGKSDEAVKHYMHARKGPINGHTVTQATKEDFEQLRKLGISNPLMPAILAQMDRPQ